MSASAGRVLILPKGDYDNTVEYKMLDMVTYQNGSYLCKQTTTGNLPTDTTYWQEMVSVDDMTGASAGAAGVHGLVPAPSAGDQAKYLRGDATWAELDLSSKADQSIIGGSYNASTAYEPGDRFSYNGVRYKVIIESGTVQGQTPPNATYYEVCSVDDDIVQLNNSLTPELLWQNTLGYDLSKVQYSSGNISVDSSRHSIFYMQIAYGYAGNGRSSGLIFDKNPLPVVQGATPVSIRIGSGTRYFQIINNSTIYISASTSSADTQWTDVPVTIYGII